MGKTLHNSTRKRTGFFNDAQRNAIRSGSVNKNTKSDLIGEKNGSIAIDLKALVEDFRLIADSPFFDSWRQNYQIVQDLMSLESIISQIQTPVPFRRKIAATEKNGKRMYYLQKVKLESIAKAGPRISETNKILCRGLKENEWKIIKNFIDKNGYAFPLEEGKDYTWEEVKKLLKEHSSLKSIPMNDKIRERRLGQIKMAWSMIRQKITPEYERKIISKTSFGVGLFPYLLSVED